MNRAELVDRIAEMTGQSKVATRDTVTAIWHIITSEIARGKKVTLVGFGTFEQRHRRARTGVNPQNPSQKLRIAAAKVPAFRAGRELKSIVDGRAKMPAAPTHAAKAAPKAKKAAKKAAPAKKPAKKTAAKKRKR